MDTIHQRFAALQWEGLRDYQEDDFGFLDARDSDQSSSGHTVIMVADGMGGHNNGARASQLATEAFVNSYQHHAGMDIPARLQTALLHSNDMLAEAIRENPDLEGMGTTLVAVVISKHSLHWISVGDSPLWLLRQGELQRLNADHSMAPLLAEMVSSGKITADEAAIDPNRHSLLSALMGDSLELIDQSTQGLPLLAGDLVLLASDGILTLDEATLRSTLEENKSKAVQEIAELLLGRVKKVKRPGQDNLTLALFRPEGSAAIPAAAPVSSASHRTATATRRPLTGLYAFIGGGLTVLLIVLLILWFNSNSEPVEEPAAVPETAPPSEAAPELTPPPAAALIPPSQPGPSESQSVADEKAPNPPLLATPSRATEGGQAADENVGKPLEPGAKE